MNMEGGRLIGGVGVVPTTKIIEVAIDLFAVPGLCSLEHHVFEEMTHAHVPGLLVSRTRANEESHSTGMGRGIDCCDDAKAVGQHVIAEVYGHVLIKHLSSCEREPRNQLLMTRFSVSNAAS